MIDRVLSSLENGKSQSLDRLKDFVSIPSVSTDPAHADACRTAAEWVAGQLRECGLSAEIHPTPGHPVVLGRCQGGAAGTPTVLFYGHYDVQPPDPLELWKTPPFEPSVRDGRLYARGASDDKGQVCCFLEALRAWKESTGGIPLNLIVMIEGEEECGSVNLEKFIAGHLKELKSDIAVISDTAMWAPGKPAITYALRGLLYFDLKLFGPDRDLHSGVYGGTMANPATELMLVLGQLFDRNHKVTIPGFYDEVRPLAAAERARWQELNFSDTQWAASIGVSELHGEAGFSTLERRWGRPSCDVNGLYGGYMGKGAKTVIPSFAGAKVSFRLAADQNPDRIAESFKQWLEARRPPGCRWEISEFGRAYPVCLSTDSPYLAAAAEAVEKGTGVKPVLVREGATIPVVSTFKTELGVETLLIGFGLNDDALHSPNEKFDLACYEMGCRTHAALIDRLSRGV